MRRLIAFALWATAAAMACWVVEPAYRFWLTGVVNAVLRSFGLPTLSVLTLPVPYDLGLFVALCLATPRIARGERLRALALGGAGMVALEVLVVVLGLAIQVWSARRPWAAQIGLRLNVGLLHSLQLVTAPLLWLVLLGGRELGEGSIRRRPPAAEGRRAPAAGHAPHT